MGTPSLVLPSDASRPIADCTLSYYYQNVRGLNSKLKEAYFGLLEYSFDIICLTETWFSDSVLNTKLFPIGYQVARCDRRFDMMDLSRGGEVLLAVDRTISFTTIDVSSIWSRVPGVDVVMGRIGCGSNSVLIGVIYIPPPTSSTELETFFSTFEAIVINDRVLIFGDFNLNLWESNTDTKSKVFRSFAETNKLIQLNNILNSHDKMLDLVLTNVEMVSTVRRSVLPLVAEDPHHPTVKWEVSCSPVACPSQFPFTSIPQLNFKRANF